MSTHNICICFYEDLTKIIFKLSSNILKHAPYLFCCRQSLEDYTTSFAGIGTTAEIYSIKNEMDEGTGISTVRVKARGRQRFELLDYKGSITG